MRDDRAGLRVLRAASDEPWPDWAEELVGEDTDESDDGKSATEPARERRIVKIAPGEGARFWPDCLAEGYVCIAWDEVGDLRKYPTQDDFLTAFRIQFPASGCAG